MKDWREQAAAIPDLKARANYLRERFEDLAQPEREAIWWARLDVAAEGIKGLCRQQAEKTDEDANPWEDIA